MLLVEIAIDIYLMEEEYATISPSYFDLKQDRFVTSFKDCARTVFDTGLNVTVKNNVQIIKNVSCDLI